jgi:hypothetical protein
MLNSAGEIEAALNKVRRVKSIMKTPNIENAARRS